jgi:hypothetical protein
VLGELLARTWLSQTLPAEAAARAAAGWGGDRAAIYDAPPAARGADAGTATLAPEPPLVWLTIWDDAAEADDFARAADQIPGPVTIARRADAVALLFGPRDLAPAALATTLDAWRASTTRTKMGTLKGSPCPSTMGCAGRSPATPDAKKGARPRRVAPPDCPRRDRTAAPR